ncbi:MAG: alpha-galactosidase [Clostridia bacterium]|nr:alpha-galactosidase [Clostridia bacterium]
MIYFDNEHQYFYLCTENTSYIMQAMPEGILRHTYYGAKIPVQNMEYFKLDHGRSYTPQLFLKNGGEISINMLPQECPTMGRGDFRRPAITVLGDDGRTVNELHYASYEILEDKPLAEGLPQFDRNVKDVQTLKITLADSHDHFEVDLLYSVFEKEDVITRRTVVRNVGKSAVKIIDLMAATIDLETADFDVITLEGDWARERSVERHPLFHGTTSIESRRSASGHQLNPFMALVGKNTNETMGEVYAMTWVYSGDFKASAEVDPFGNTRFQMGFNPETFEWTLGANESFTTPETVMTYSATGLNAMSQNFHQMCRKHLGACADEFKRPIVINSWEAMYMYVSEERIRQFAEQCKGLGIDTFVLDDGWFADRNSEVGSMGDWTVNPTKFPNGLDRAIEICRENGMRFGIWFEPEMISEDSETYRKHPDWCIHVDGRTPVLSRSEMILDLSRQEVVDGIYEQMAAILDNYDISYVKWDMNRNMSDYGTASLPADRQREHSHRYMLGLYSLIQRLKDAFPHVFFEGCAGGGGRFDFGILYYMPQIWTSDNTDPAERLRVQYGTSLVYPPCTMSAHVSDSPCQQTGRVTSFETRGNVAQMCNFGYELDATHLSDDDKEMIKEQVQQHKRLEPMIADGKFYRLISPFEGRHCAWQLVSEDKTCAYALFSVRETIANPHDFYLKLQGLDPNADYRVSGFEVPINGAVLMNAGLPIILPVADYATVTFNIEKC